ncbi:MAG TPA: DOMON-like domain-containing protein [Candidatus Binataceae bacterium]|nr:DOMON-like domain-containing protein [Candidatus Binataceae bacterium]
MNIEHWIELRCHPSHRPKEVHAIGVLVGRSANAELQITFRLDGDISGIRVPLPGTPGIGTDLWRHTCFEAFIAAAGQTAYHEFNFAPSGEWAVYALRGYRDGVPIRDETMRPHIAVRSSSNRLELDAVIRLDSLSALHPRASLRIGLAAVIEAGDGLSYWALRHRAGKPDFHDAEGFALSLGPPGPERQGLIRQ